MSAIVGKDFALHMYKTYGSGLNADYIKTAAREHNASRKEALMLIYAGAIYAHVILGALVSALSLRPATVQEFALIARGLKGPWKKPGVGKVNRKQLGVMAELVQGLDFGDLNRAFTLLRSRAAKHNEDYEQQVAAAKRAEYEQRKAQGVEVQHPVVSLEDIGPPSVDAAPHEEAPVIEFPEKKGFWDKSELSASITKDRPGYNTFTLKGIADADALVLQECLRRISGGLDEEIQKLSPEQRAGHAAYVLFLEQTRRGDATAKIRLNMICNIDTLATHPEWAITFNGVAMDSTEIYELVTKWGADESLLVTDLNGRVISKSTARFAPEGIRIMWAATTNRCVVPHCKNQACLEFHHLEDYVKLPRTDLYDVRPVCRRCHRMLTNGRATLELFDEFQTAMWIENGHTIIDVAAHPTGTMLQAVGKKYGYDPLVPEEYAELRRILIAETRKLIANRQVAA
ncbi:MAG: HNH endonuclease signature motif containing protein [Corynebacterium sp.]|nr:HNH endonuclease signature motif containing protein [Corynebacterium sp.]